MTIVELLQNQFFSGVVGGSAVVSLVYALKALPGRAFEAVRWRFSCSLTVFSEDAAFERVSAWIAELKGAERCRNLRLTSQWDNEQQTETERMSPGVGSHLLWYQNRPIFISRTLPDKSAVGGTRRLEDIKLTTFGGSPELLRSLLEEIRRARVEMRGRTIDVYTYHHRWRLVCRKPKRRIETVVLPRAQKEGVMDDVRKFLERRDWYLERGIPYRRGYLFEGAPGCGKTSLALAIASEFSRPIYALNLGSVQGDFELIEAIAEVPEHAVLLIEDVDAAAATTAKRTPEPATYPAIGTPIQKEEPTPVSLSALLNVLDGVFSRDGRILIMTTNHPDKVDPALLRTGRADRRERIQPLGYEEAAEFCERFMASHEVAPFLRRWRTPVAASDLQERLLQREEAEAAE